MLRKVAAVLLLSLTALAARAADLSIGLAFEITTMDPHFANIGPNTITSQHMFDGLVNPQRSSVKMKPALAESWKAIDDVTWEFKLRKGVKFHDGSEMTAEDVIYSYDRPGTITNSPSPFTLYTKVITEKIMVDKYTVRFKTAAPYALMISAVSNIFIVSKKATQGLSTDDFNTGKGLIGTGPYKFVRFLRGDRVEMVRNENYWGEKAPWEKVTLRMMTTPSARVAALLAGDVNAIEGVPPADLARLKASPDVKLFDIVSNRLIYLQVDSGRDESPFVTDKAGHPMKTNPLRDARVRLAISKAINRQAIVERVMEGNAVAAGQLLPVGSFGASTKLKVEPFDPNGAKKLLAEAGYPDGFGLTIHSPNNRYVNDEKVLQTIAQMLSKIGIATKVETMPAAVYFTRQVKRDYSLGMSGWGGGTGDAGNYLRPLMETYNAEKGLGTSNNGRYSNPKLDALIEQGYATIDLGPQEKIWQQATEIGIGDTAVIPLHHQVNIWAARKGYAYYPRTDERTLAMEFYPTNK
jgi:peptide/nickel transport system substrate-binding protein